MQGILLLFINLNLSLTLFGFLLGIIVSNQKTFSSATYIPLVIIFCLLIYGLILGKTICSSKLVSKSWASIPGTQLSATKSNRVPSWLSSGCLPWISIAKFAPQNCWLSILKTTSIFALPLDAITPLKFFIWYLPIANTFSFLPFPDFFYFLL